MAVKAKRENKQLEKTARFRATCARQSWHEAETKIQFNRLYFD